MCIKRWSTDASKLLAGELVFSSVEIKKMKYIHHFLRPVTINGIVIILKRQANDQLPGGKHWGVNIYCDRGRLQKRPCTNTISVRDFSSLDMVMRTKPSALTSTYECIVMWTQNKTSKWLSTLAEDENMSALKDARKNAPVIQNRI
ncbi:hypothetical protein MAR_026038 [Mya arenaria]|uniref:Uncharacterized protein n=1 Tax=Mya arenaria TaxID=6604 RepID=A0ABY7ETH8_MYAAR|nr:hypothetical protein MAR_026038 [Mya arenaria]